MHAIRCGFAAILLFSLWALADAAAPEITPDDLAFFLEESYSRYSGEPDPDDLEDQFYRIAASAGSPEAAVRGFAGFLEVPEERAAEYAVAIIESVRFRDRCEDARSGGACAFGPGEPLYDALLDGGFADQTGRIAAAVGENLPDYGTEQRRALRVFIDAVRKHPAHTKIFSRLYAYGEEPEYLAALLAGDTPGAATAMLARHAAGTFEPCTAEGAGTFLALLDVSRENVRSAAAADARETDLLFTEAIIRLQLQAGLTAEAVDSYEDHARALRTHLAAKIPAFVDPDNGEDFAADSAELAADLAYAVFDDGDAMEARRLLAVYASQAEAAGDDDKPNALASALEEAMAPRLSADELYDRYIYGRSAGEPQAAPDDDEYELPGWLFRLQNSPAIVRSVIAKRLRAAGYADMARFLYEPESPRCAQDVEPALQAGDTVPAGFLERKDFWSRKIQSAWDALDAQHRKAVSEAGTFVYRGPDPLVFEEHELPAKFVRPVSSEAPGEATVPADVVLPADRPSVVRFAEENGEKQIVYLSSAIDRPGEIPALGIWFQQTSGGGESWEPPLYLGMQQYFPYVVVPDSKLPLLANGHLQIEVEVHEIDPASITFPPVGLTFKREQHNLYVDFALDDLKRDSDSDGMTDIVENKLGLNPQQADTDGDGIVDGADSLPLTPYDPDTPPTYTELAAAIMKAVYGYERAAIMEAPREPAGDDDVSDALEGMQSRKPEPNTLMLIANPKYFTGLRLFDQLLVYSEADAELLGGGTAPFYPVRLSALFAKKNGREFYVAWSASWVGGAFTVRCREGACEANVLSSWIT